MPYSCKSYAKAQELHWESRAQIHWQVWFTALHMLAVNGPDCVLGSHSPENWCRLPPPHMKNGYSSNSGDRKAKQSIRMHECSANGFLKESLISNVILEALGYKKTTTNMLPKHRTITKRQKKKKRFPTYCIGCGTIYLYLMKSAFLIWLERNCLTRSFVL